MLYAKKGSGNAWELNFDAAGRLVRIAGWGSGFSISKEGYILTAGSLVRPDLTGDEWVPKAVSNLIPVVSLNVMFHGTSERFPARIVKINTEESRDLALLKIEAGESVPYIEDFDCMSEATVHTSEVYAIGFPAWKDSADDLKDSADYSEIGLSDLPWDWKRPVSTVFTVGVVSRLGRSRLEFIANMDDLSFDGIGIPSGGAGAVGGPLVDENGRVIGIVLGNSKEETVGFGFAMPISHANAVWPVR